MKSFTSHIPLCAIAFAAVMAGATAVYGTTNAEKRATYELRTDNVAADTTLVQGMDMAALDSVLQRVHDDDQNVRRNFTVMLQSNNADSILAYQERMEETDSRCRAIVFPILDSVGIPDGLTEKAREALFLVVQHSDVEHQRKYIDLFDAAAKTELVSRADVATMRDRILMHEGLPQIYGTQTFTSNRTIIINSDGGKRIADDGEDNGGESSASQPTAYLWPVESAEGLDARRVEVGLPPMDKYIELFRQSGVILVWDRSLTVDKIKAQRGKSEQ